MIGASSRNTGLAQWLLSPLWRSFFTLLYLPDHSSSPSENRARQWSMVAKSSLSSEDTACQRLVSPSQSEHRACQRLLSPLSSFLCVPIR